MLTNVAIRNYGIDDSANLNYQIVDDEGNLSDYLSNLMDNDEEDDGDIYDVERDPNLFQNVNNWMYSKLQPTVTSVEANNNKVVVFDYEDSDELRSLRSDSEQEADLKFKCPEFNEKTYLHRNVHKELGMKFDSHETFRKALSK